MKTMEIKRGFIVLILVNLVWSAGSKCVRKDEISPQSPAEFVEGTPSVLDLDASPKELSAEERCIGTMEEDTSENDSSSEENSSEDDSLDEDTPEGESPQEVEAEDCDHLVKLNNAQIELAKRRRPVSQPWHPNNTEVFYEYDKDGRVFNPSIKYCAFFGQLINSTTAFVSLVPKNASEREARLNRSMHNEWKHRVQVVDDLVEKLILTPTSETFARFWRAFHDLDIRVQNSTTQKKAPPNVLKKLLTKLTTVATLQDAEAVWREDILFWAKTSTRAHQLILFGESKSFSLSPVQHRIIREFTKLTPVDELNRRHMLKYPFFSPSKNIPDSATRMDIMTEIYLSCLWIMRVEHQDPRVARLVHYLTTTWREVGILEEETDQLFVMHSFCIGVSELHMFYNAIDVPCSRADGADVQLTRHEYDIYLNFIRRKFRSRINRDTARITLATFYNNGQGPIKLNE